MHALIIMGEAGHWHCKCEHAYLALLFGLLFFTVFSLIHSWLHPETLQGGTMDIDEPVLIAVLVLPVVCICLYECEIELGHADSAPDVRARLKASMHAVLLTIQKPGKTMMNRFNDRGKRMVGLRAKREDTLQV